jgi:hypothetical protein
VQARRIALGDRTPVVLANLGSDRYHPGSLASERPVLVVRWGLLSMVVRSLSLSVSCAGVNSWVDLYNDHGSAGSGWCAGSEESRSVGQLKLQQGLAFVSLQAADVALVSLQPLEARDREGPGQAGKGVRFIPIGFSGR